MCRQGKGSIVGGAGGSQVEPHTASAFLSRAALALCATLAMAACQVDALSWYPSGKASIASSYEYSDSGGKACVATIEIANTGKSSINSCTVSISAATDARIYRHTIVKDIILPPEKRVYFDVEIAYISEAETLKESGLAIVDEYYL